MPIDRGGGLPTPTEMRPSIGGVLGVGGGGGCPEGRPLEQVVPHHPPRDVPVHLPGLGYQKVWGIGLGGPVGLQMPLEGAHPESCAGYQLLQR